jgi:predicted amidophosphoribosyltransferase
MAPKTGPLKCPQCGTDVSIAHAFGGRAFCGGCGQQLIFCRACGGANLELSNFCHNCGKPIEKESSEFSSRPGVQAQIKSAAIKEVPIERMHLCASCKKAIGEGEPFCSYCGARQAASHTEAQAQLDPRTMKVAVTMLARITEAKDHPEYSVIDELTTMIGEVAVGNEKPHDAHELSFSDQLRLLTLVFEYTRDKVSYKGETFGEHIRWSWETIKTGGDCDCKVVLLATMLASLAFRRMHLLILPQGKYVDVKDGGEIPMQGHVILEVELSERSRLVRVSLDPSCPDCDVDEIPETVRPLIQNFYRVPVIP